MIIFCAGSIYGQINKFYDRVLAVEKELKVQAEWILVAGNMGIWPDPQRIDRATRKHAGSGDFAKMYIDCTPVPRQTVVISGAHDDHEWLQQRVDRNSLELIPGLAYLVNGNHTVIGDMSTKLNVCGLGKVFSEKSFYSSLTKVSPINHYTRGDIQRCLIRPFELFITHEAPKGARFGHICSTADGINDVVSQIRPKLLVHGHVNQSKTYLCHDGPTKAVSLADGEIAVFDYLNGEFLRLDR